MTIEAWHVWLSVGLVFWIVEIFTSGFVAGVFGTACLLATPVAGMDEPFKTQLLVFGMAAGTLGLGIRPLILKHFCARDDRARTNVDALIGATGLVVEAIGDRTVDGAGRVKIGGESWRAVTGDRSPIECGREVTVLAVRGCTVVVQPINHDHRRPE